MYYTIADFISIPQNVIAYASKCAQVERTEVGGVLATLVRSCIDTCYYGCRPRGFGIYVEPCASCCETDGCNDFYPQLDDGGAAASAARQGNDNAAAAVCHFSMTLLVATFTLLFLVI